MFVVVEGIEGSGKSTLVAGLASHLRSAGYDVAETREPGGTAAGDEIRTLLLRTGVALVPWAEAFLVSAARAQHVEEVIRPALAAGKIVICDRFTDSTLAYQGYGRGLPLERLRSLCAMATAGVEPDLVLLLDLPVAAARERTRMRETDRIEGESDEFHERVRAGFLALASPRRHRILDGTTPRGVLLERAHEEVRAGLDARVS
jgi:dTMP kinase